MEQGFASATVAAAPARKYCFRNSVAVASRLVLSAPAAGPRTLAGCLD